MAEKLTNEEKRIIKNDYLKRSKLAAPPWYSEHHTGKAFDILWDSGRLEENDKEFIWLKKNAKQFWFELSYPDPNSDRYEPRHRLYVWKK
jgi:D-alanyl-D-alanine carboxypeptidase